uniref:guanylate-binding protein 1-like n=1 Tax=Pristiophorus japonicus TaxID=55135 RepID=UPI00398EA36A
MEEMEMDEPMMLVENVEGKLRVNPDALKVLSSIEVPVVVVAVAGAARTGKSYLLNRLARAKKGFSLGSTVQSHTKGIWMWCLPHPRRPDQRFILLDTEGLGDPEKGDEHNDNSVFALAILLSSVFVFNSQGTINQQSMRDLHFVTELAKRIQVKSQPDGGEERDFIQFFPDFVWSLRDLTLDLEINGTDVTADQYLENSLRLRNEPEIFPLIPNNPEMFPLIPNNPEMFPLIRNNPEMFPLIPNNPEMFPLMPNNPEMFPLIPNNPEMFPLIPNNPEMFPLISNNQDVPLDTQ